MPLRPEPAPAPPPRRAGFALPMLMAALALGGIVAGVIGSGSVLLARMSREALYSDTARMVVKQATMRLVTESADIDNDGFPEPPAMDTAGSAKPAGGGNVPATSAAPILGANVSLKVKKVVADEVQAGKLQAGSVQSGNLQAARVTTGELGMVLDGGAQQDLLDLPLQASYTVVVSGPDGSFVHATVLNTGGLIQITAKHLNGLDLLATGTRLRVVNTSVQTKRLNASWTRVG